MPATNRSVVVDPALVRKYNVPGPRYTSYPTALKFGPVDEAELERRLDRAAAGEKEISVYLHLPFCQTLCWFCGCSVVIRKGGDAGDYLGVLEKEIALRKRWHAGKRAVQVHFGGGTPTYLTPEQLRRLGEVVRANFSPTDDVEYSVEVDPRRLTRDHVRALAEIGVNRISMGVQDFNETVQKAVNRIQPFEDTKRAIEWFREEKISSINLDLIYGLPFQTVASFEETVDRTLELRPERIVTFSYAHVPWMKKQQSILEKTGMPDPEEKILLFKSSIEKITKAGFVYIGLDHFALPDDELARAQERGELQRNFQGYSTCGGADIHAFGMSGVSQSADAYYQNLKDLDDYTDRVTAGGLPFERGYLLTADDRIRRSTIMQLLCNLELDYAAMSTRLGIDFRDYFSAELGRLTGFEADGLLERDDRSVRITDPGRLFIRNIAMTFDAYRIEGDRAFSRTV